MYEIVVLNFFQSGNTGIHGALGRRKIERGPLWTCRVHRRQLHRGYPIILPYPKAILGGLSHSYTSTFLPFVFVLIEPEF